MLGFPEGPPEGDELREALGPELSEGDALGFLDGTELSSSTNNNSLNGAAEGLNDSISFA